MADDRTPEQRELWNQEREHVRELIARWGDKADTVLPDIDMDSLWDLWTADRLRARAYEAGYYPGPDYRNQRRRDLFAAIPPELRPERG